MSTLELKFETDKGWTEAIIVDNCDFERFYSVAEVLSKHFNVVFESKATGLDEAYWDFDYNGCKLCLHYNIYLGISIFPELFKLASEKDNSSVLDISKLLFQRLADLNFFEFENGNNIVTKRSE